MWPHSRRDVAAQEWRQCQREDKQWLDAVVVGEGERSRAHGRAAQSQRREMKKKKIFCLYVNRCLQSRCA